MSLWPGAKLPDLAGKSIIITGANSGIGYYAALELAKAGAEVIMACRSTAKGEAAAAKVNAEAPGKAVFMALDLADLNSVRAFAAAFKEGHGSLDMLINNAGVMALPKRQVTAQGFEQQFGVNFLGHFLLTALLLITLMNAPAPRVIQISSLAHRQGKMAFDDLQYERGYKPWPVYQQSKLAMLVFAEELQRRSDAGGWGLLSLAAHPGLAATELVSNGPGNSSFVAFALNLVKGLVMQPGDAGAWPTILAAIDESAKPGAYYGPQGLSEMRGPPGPAKIMPRAMDKATGAKLWDVAEALTGADFKPAP